MRVSVGDVRLFFEAFGQEWAFTGSTMERRPALIGLHGGPGLEESAARFREAGGEEAAQVVRRAMESPSEQTAAEWRRVLGPLASLNPDPYPSIARLEAERIETLDVNVHFTREGKAMDLRVRLGAVRCPTLVILGEADATIPTHLGREIVEAIPDGLARLELVPEAAHEVMVDKPAESYRLLREFLAEVAY